MQHPREQIDIYISSQDTCILVIILVIKPQIAESKERILNKRKESSIHRSKGNKNPFTVLQRYDIECYKCNNHGHMARDCKPKTHTRNTIAIKPQNTKQKKYWKKKEEMESSMIFLCATESQKLWHLDCSISCSQPIMTTLFMHLLSCIHNNS